MAGSHSLTTRANGKTLKVVIGYRRVFVVAGQAAGEISRHADGRACLPAPAGKSIDEVFIATCDQEILDAVKSIGAKAHDAQRHRASACALPKPADSSNSPTTTSWWWFRAMSAGPPGMIDLAVQPMLDDPAIQLVTLVAYATKTEWHDPNGEGCDQRGGRTVYVAQSASVNEWKHIGLRLKQVSIMPFRKKFLLEFQAIPPTPYEIAEQVELLRAVEHGVKIRAVKSPYQSIRWTPRATAKRPSRHGGDEFYLVIRQTSRLK